MNRKSLLLAFALLFATFSFSQNVTLTPDQIKALTPQWKGERFPDGRPKAPDDLLERLKGVALEEA